MKVFLEFVGHDCAERISWSLTSRSVTSLISHFASPSEEETSLSPRLLHLHFLCSISPRAALYLCSVNLHDHTIVGETQPARASYTSPRLFPLYLV